MQWVEIVVTALHSHWNTHQKVISVRPLVVLAVKVPMLGKLLLVIIFPSMLLTPEAGVALAVEVDGIITTVPITVFQKAVEVVEPEAMLAIRLQQMLRMEPFYYQKVKLPNLRSAE